MVPTRQRDRVPGDSFTLRTPGFIAFVTVTLAVMNLICIPAAATSEGLRQATDAASIAVPLVYLFVRAWFLGVRVTPTELRLRSWFRTRRIENSRIRGLELVRYDGLLSRGGRSRRLWTCRLQVGERQIPVWGLVGKRSTLERIGGTLVGQLGLSPSQMTVSQEIGTALP